MLSLRHPPFMARELTEFGRGFAPKARTGKRPPRPVGSGVRKPRKTQHPISTANVSFWRTAVACLTIDIRREGVGTKTARKMCFRDRQMSCPMPGQGRRPPSLIEVFPSLRANLGFCGDKGRGGDVGIRHLQGRTPSGRDVRSCRGCRGRSSRVWRCQLP